MASSPAQQVAQTPDARRRLGRRLLLGAAAAAVAAVPLTVLTAAVVSRNDALGRLDHDTAEALHRFVVARPTWGTVLGWLSVVTHPNVMRLACAVLAVVLWRRRHQRVAVWLVVTMAVGGGLDPILKDLVARTRPVFSDPVALAPGYSFPSGHALNSMLFAGCLLVLGHRFVRPRPGPAGEPGRRPRRRLAALWAACLTLVVVTGFDRIALGVHYVSDVLAGWLVALATLGATTVAFESWRREEGLPA